MNPTLFLLLVGVVGAGGLVYRMWRSRR